MIFFKYLFLPLRSTSYLEQNVTIISEQYSVSKKMYIFPLLYYMFYNIIIFFCLLHCNEIIEIFKDILINLFIFLKHIFNVEIHLSQFSYITPVIASSAHLSVCCLSGYNSAKTAQPNDFKFNIQDGYKIYKSI